MSTLQQKQEQQISLNQGQSQFSCNICRRLAEDPVVTKCGHLFCWQCVHSHQLCTVCYFQILEDEFVPIYTYVNGVDRSRNIMHKVKPKPKAKNLGKIKNSASLGPSNEFSALYSNLNDNIQRSTLLAGNGYCPATVFTLLGSTDEELQQFEIGNKGVKRKIMVLSWCLLFVVCACVMLSLGMDRQSI